MNNKDFEFLTGFLKDKSGLIITVEKTYLLESRLLPLAKDAGLDGLEGLVAHIKTNPFSPIVKDVIEAMTTNETSFFRDSRPFDNFKDTILPYFLEKKKVTRKLRIWSAACSSGQEPYSIAMLLNEMGAKLQGWNIEIVATDLSTDILDKASEGVYSQFEIQRGLPIQLLVKYFEQEEEKWKVKSSLKDNITFKVCNLLEPCGHLGMFDIVFCRNVLIYFDKETKKKVLDSIYKQMHNDGALILGGAETVLGITDSFKSLEDRRGVYVRNDTSFKIIES